MRARALNGKNQTRTRLETIAFTIALRRRCCGVARGFLPLQQTVAFVAAAAAAVAVVVVAGIDTAQGHETATQNIQQIPQHQPQQRLAATRTCTLIMVTSGDHRRHSVISIGILTRAHSQGFTQFLQIYSKFDRLFTINNFKYKQIQNNSSNVAGTSALTVHGIL